MKYLGIFLATLSLIGSAEAATCSVGPWTVATQAIPEGSSRVPGNTWITILHQNQAFARFSADSKYSGELPTQMNESDPYEVNAVFGGETIEDLVAHGPSTGQYCSPRADECFPRVYAAHFTFKIKNTGQTVWVSCLN